MGAPWMRYMTLVMSLPLVMVKPMSFQSFAMSTLAPTLSSTIWPQARSTSGASAMRSVRRSPSRSVEYTMHGVWRIMSCSMMPKLVSEMCS